MGKIIKIREVGELVLNKMSEEVDIININNDILDIIEDLKTTLIDGIGLGISAPKIGINKRIIVVGAKRVTDKDGFATKENRKKYNL
ncbi:MAG: peptide deformylase [Clostridia bacterium]|jgi:peptide deformylase|uniref:peptide deformylase n=1 Tax=Candidatus Merdicola sp. TaxID=3085652 RepID=UPI002FA080C4